jgi:hypothetical protein
LWTAARELKGMFCRDGGEMGNTVYVVHCFQNYLEKFPKLLGNIEGVEISK